MLKQPFCPWVTVCLVAGLLVGTAALGQQKYRLRDTYTAGDMSTVDSSMDMSMSIQASANGQEVGPFTFVRRDHERYSEKLLAVDAKGPSGVQRIYTLAQGDETDPTGNETKKASSLQGQTVVIRRKGDQVTVTATPGKLNTEDQKSLLTTLDHSDMDLLPDHEVGPGEEWAVDPKLVAGVMEGMDKAEVKCHFQDVVEHAGRQCARLQVTMNLSGQPKGVPGPMTVKLTGEVYEPLDLKRALDTELSGPITMTGQQTANGTVLNFKGEGTMRLKETRHWLKVNGKPIPAKA